MSFQAASRKQAKLRLLIDGTSGSGKTHTMLKLLRVFGKKIAVIDSENHSVEKKSNELIAGIDVDNIANRSIDSYVKAIKEAERLGYDALGIDSLSHPWQELLEAVDKIATQKFSGNSFRAWSEGTPNQRQLMEAILFSGMHIIATGRVKTEWTTENNAKGKMEPKKVGLDVVQGKGIEYEFDVWMRMDSENTALVLKDRFDMGIQGKYFEKPGEKFGKTILNFLNTGEIGKAKEVKELPRAEAIQQADPVGMSDAMSQIFDLMAEMGWEPKKRELALQRVKIVGEEAALSGVSKAYQGFLQSQKNAAPKADESEGGIF